MINLLEAAVVAVMVLFAIAGFRKGFVKKFAAMVSLALSIVLVSALLPYITQYLKENTPVYTFLVEQYRNYGKQVLNSLTGSGKEPERIPDLPQMPMPIWGGMRSGRFWRRTAMTARCSTSSAMNSWKFKKSIHTAVFESVPVRIVRWQSGLTGSTKSLTRIEQTGDH